MSKSKFNQLVSVCVKHNILSDSLTVFDVPTIRDHINRNVDFYMVRMPAIFRVGTWKLAHVLNVNLKSNVQQPWRQAWPFFSSMYGILVYIQIPSLGRGEGDALIVGYIYSVRWKIFIRLWYCQCGSDVEICQNNRSFTFIPAKKTLHLPRRYEKYNFSLTC